MNYNNGTEVKINDYVITGENIQGVMRRIKRVLDYSTDDCILFLVSFDDEDIESYSVKEVEFDSRGAPEATGKTEVFIIKKWGWRVVLKMDTSLTPDESFRDFFYNFYTLRQMAEHFVWNRYKQGFKGQVEGFYEEQCEPPYLWVLDAEKVK